MWSFASSIFIKLAAPFLSSSNLIICLLRVSLSSKAPSLPILKLVVHHVPEMIQHFSFLSWNVSNYGKEWEWRGLAFSLRRIFFSSNCIGLRQRELVIQSQIQGLTKAWHVTNLTAQGWAWAVIDVCCCAFFVWWNNRNGTFKKLTDIHRWPQSMELFCSCSGGSPYLPRCMKTLFSLNSMTRMNIIFSPIFM